MNWFLPPISLAVTLALTPLVKYAAPRLGWIAVPGQDRWHKKPTAVMGGIAIYAACMAVLVPSFDMDSLLSRIGTLGHHPPSLNTMLVLGMTLMFLLGLLDDRIAIKPHTKLVGQILVASLVAFFGFRLNWFASLTLDTVITIVWIVGITNAINLIDNMDGLCAGISLMAALYFSLLLQGVSPGGETAALVLAGALAGFLVYNFHPARIFMGDCGSLTIGFALSMLGMTFASSAATTPLATIAVPVMVLMVPVLDTTLVTLIRLLSGRRASTGGRDHTSHRLVLMGFTERGAVLFLYGVGAISGIAALFVNATDSITSPAVIMPLAVAMLLMGIYMAQIRVYPEKEFSILRNRAYTPILIELTYKQQLALVILDFGLIAFSYYLAYRLQYSSQDFVYYFKLFLHSLPAIIACKFVAFFVIGVYRGIWRYMSAPDVYIHLKASAFATLLSVAAVTFLYQFQDFSKGIFVIDWLLTTGLLLGTRGSFRIALDAMNRKTLAGPGVLIYGAGRGGEILLREILNNQKLGIQPVGFVDDDVMKKGKKLQGYPILGTFAEADRLLELHGFTGVLVSFNGAEPNNFEGARRFCQRHGLFLKRFRIRLEVVDLEERSDRGSLS